MIGIEQRTERTQTDVWQMLRVYVNASRFSYIGS